MWLTLFTRNASMTIMMALSSMSFKCVDVQFLNVPCSFFKSLQRITSPSYNPSLEDMSRVSVEIQSVQTVLIPRKSAQKRYYYRFIDTVDSDNDRSRWIHSSANVSLVVHIVDTAAYDVTGPGNESINGVMKDLILFQRICSSRWLAETPVLVLLSNIERMAGKLPHSSIGLNFEDYSGDPTDSRSVKAYFHDLFLRAERKYNMRVWVDFIESNPSAGTGKNVIRTIDKILTEKTVLRFGKR